MNPSLPFLIHCHAHRSPRNLDEIDLNRLRQKRVPQAADDNRRDEEHKSFAAKITHSSQELEAGNAEVRSHETQIWFLLLPAPRFMLTPSPSALQLNPNRPI